MRPQLELARTPFTFAMFVVRRVLVLFEFCSSLVSFAFCTICMQVCSVLSLPLSVSASVSVCLRLILLAVFGF